MDTLMQQVPLRHVVLLIGDNVASTSYFISTFLYQLCRMIISILGPKRVMISTDVDRSYIFFLQKKP